MSSLLEKPCLSLLPVGISPFSSFHLPHRPPCCSCSGPPSPSAVSWRTAALVSLAPGKPHNLGSSLTEVGGLEKRWHNPQGNEKDMQRRKKSMDKKRATKIGVHRLTSAHLHCLVSMDHRPGTLQEF